jgi:hypothetical protein
MAMHFTIIIALLPLLALSHNTTQVIPKEDYAYDNNSY